MEDTVSILCRVFYHVFVVELSSPRAGKKEHTKNGGLQTEKLKGKRWKAILSRHTPNHTTSDSEKDGKAELWCLLDVKIKGCC